MIVLGLIAGVAGTALLAWGAPAAIIVGALLVAAAKAGLQSMATTLTGDVVSEAQRGRAIGVLHTAGDFGSAVGPSVAYALLPLIQLPGIYWLSAAVFALTLGAAR